MEYLRNFNNRITIEGNTSLAFTEDVATRFIAYGWNVTRVSDANNLEMLAGAFRDFQNTKDRPTLIIVDSRIGYGAPHKQDTSGAHGEPLGGRRDPARKKELRLAGRQEVLRAGGSLRSLPSRHWTTR